MNRECIEITFEINCLNMLLRSIDNKNNQDISIDYESTRQTVSYFSQTKRKMDCISRLLDVQTRQTFICSKSTIKTLEKEKKYVQR